MRLIKNFKCSKHMSEACLPYFKKHFRSEFNPLFFEQIFSPYHLQISSEIFNACQNFIKTFYQHTRTMPIAYKNEAERVIDSAKTTDSSVLMAYDFHIDSNNQPRLIEVNTNAAGYLPINLLHMAHDLTPDTDYRSLKMSFISEYQQVYPHKTPKHIFITDENIEEQNMYPEFLMFKDIFNSWDIEATITDYTNFSLKNNKLYHNNSEVDFIYNRFCDFLLSRPESKDILGGYLHGSACLTPHPKEYLRMADKNRLIELSHEDLNFSKFLIKTFNNFSSSDETWSNKKNLFFKPARSHGGKGVYRGKKLTKKVFERIMNSGDYIAQEYVPAQEFIYDEQKWKTDLRFFVYRDEIQLSSARIYTGQVTNFKTPNSGYAPLEII